MHAYSDWYYYMVMNPVDRIQTVWIRIRIRCTSRVEYLYDVLSMCLSMVSVIRTGPIVSSAFGANLLSSVIGMVAYRMHCSFDANSIVCIRLDGPILFLS